MQCIKFNTIDTPSVIVRVEINNDAVLSLIIANFWSHDTKNIKTITSLNQANLSQ